MSASFETCLEVVLYRLGPGWHLVGGDRDRLISGCRDWLAKRGDRESDHEDHSAESRAIWILDRLVPLDEIEVFRPLRHVGSWGMGLYALGRRAPEELASVTPEEFLEYDYFAIQAAWVDSRRSSEELLEWYAVCAERGWPAEEAHYDGLAVEEYCRREPDRAQLIGLLGNVTKQAEREILLNLIREVAPIVERTSEPQEDLAPRLEAAGDSELASICREADEKGPRDTWLLARALWVAQQTSDDLDALVEAEEDIPYWPTERLAAVCPKGRFDVWERALRVYQQRGNFPIRRFCEWLEPESRELLLPHCRRRDLDWAACAFHAYLSMLPDGLAESLAAENDRPPWQVAVLDRFLHAPPELRPPAYVTDTQETEADFRLYDPFNVRSF